MPQSPSASVAPVTQREFELQPADNARLVNLCGPLERNLRLLEDRLGVEIRRRGESFRVIGPRAQHAESALRELFALTRSEDVTPESVHLALRDQEEPMDQPAGPTHNESSDAQAARPSTLRGDEPASGEDPGRDESQSIRLPQTIIRPRGAHQREYLRGIATNDLTFGIGPAGTGKTYLAVACAVQALQSDHVRRIVLVRPAVEAGERLGFLPGDLSQKVDPYLRPMYDALYEMLGFDRVARNIERNIIEVAPLAFMRGRSLNDSFVILDEAQNTTIEQMKMFLTRIGFGSKAVVTGDVTQTDLPVGKLSGLRHVIDILKGVEGVSFNFFDARDVVRHPLVQRIVQAYEAKGGSHT